MYAFVLFAIIINEINEIHKLKKKNAKIIVSG